MKKKKKKKLLVARRGLCYSGYLGPGGRHAEGRYAGCPGGASGYVDRMILGSNHLYERPTIELVYGSGPFEPEGILGKRAGRYMGHIYLHFEYRVR